MLVQNPKTLIQSNQLKIYINKHQNFMKQSQMHLVFQGYQKLEQFISKLKDFDSNIDHIWIQQVEMQVHLVTSLAQNLVT